MITLNNITLKRGMKVLFEDISLAIFPGKRIGITGINGCGKSSLFSMLLKKLEPETGEINYTSGLKINCLLQEMSSSSLSAIEYIKTGNLEANILFEKLRKAEKHKNHTLIGELHAQLYNLDAYALESKAAKILNGLGFEKTQQTKKVNEFSGGWQARLNLGKVLMSHSDLLLLDEPTNHLDLKAIVWLEKWLTLYEGTVMIISHDRDFLDNTVKDIWHINQRKITAYHGNYTSFEKQYATNLTHQQAINKKQQEKIKHMSAFISRFRAKATKAKQVQSRLKALSKLEKVIEIHTNKSIDFTFQDCGKISPPLINVQNVSFEYIKRDQLFHDINFSILPKDRIGLLGENGVGKTTLIKMIIGAIKPQEGNIVRNDKLKIGYFSQHQIEKLMLQNSPLQYFFDIDSKATERSLRTFLGKFGFSGDMATMKMANLSGGERARLSLAALIYQKPNLLLLDEPTNHLDFETIEMLSLALQTFSGALLTVSHDRYFLRTIVDELWQISNKKLLKFDGDLNDYIRHISNTDVKKTEKVTHKKTKGSETIKLHQELKKIEICLSKKRKDKEQLDTQLSTIKINDNVPYFSELCIKSSKLATEIKALEDSWLKIIDLLE